MKNNNKKIVLIVLSVFLLIALIGSVVVYKVHDIYVEKTTLTTLDTQAQYNEVAGFKRFTDDNGIVSFLYPETWTYTKENDNFYKFYSENPENSFEGCEFKISTDPATNEKVNKKWVFNYSYTGVKYSQGVKHENELKFSKISKINDYKTIVYYDNAIYNNEERYCNVTYTTYISSDVAVQLTVQTKDPEIFDTMVGSYTVLK